MKLKIISLIATVVLGMAALASCDLGIVHKDPTASVTEDKYFVFTEIIEHSKVVGYTISANSEEELPSDIVLPSQHLDQDVKEIVFEGFKNTPVKSVTIPETCKRIGGSAFSGCTNLKTVKLGGVEKVGALAFADCTSLNTLILSDPLKEIGAFAFANTLVHTLNFKNVESIGDSAFRSCKNLKTVYIPASTTSIGENAFADCLAISFSVSSENSYYRVSSDGALVRK